MIGRAGVCLLVGALVGCGGGGALGREAQVFVVDVASGDRRQVAAGERPSWSPEGGRLAVVASSPETAAIEVLEPDGDERRRVIEAPGTIHGVVWSPRGEELAVVRVAGETSWTLETVRPDGSRRRTLARQESDQVADAGPTWSPDGTRIAYAPGIEVVVVLAARERALRRIDDAWAPRWSPDGRYLLVGRREALVAMPLDGERPVTVASGLIDAHAAWSPTSEQVAFSGVTFEGDRRYHLYLTRFGSHRLRLVADRAASTAPAWSPDGRRLAYATWDGEIVLLEPATGDTRSLTRIAGAEIRDLAWSPEGERLAFVAREVPED